MKKNKKNLDSDGNRPDSATCTKRPFVIAELGTSHNGEIVKAKEMTDAAAGAGADCVKFQMVFADEILHPNTGDVDLPGGRIRLYDRFKALETPREFYQEIKEYAESRGLLFLCTPFGLKSASILKELQPKMVKIASPELNYTGLLEETARWNIPVLLSTGVSKLGDIDRALETIRNGQSEIDNNTKTAQNFGINKDESLPFTAQCALLHCVTSYPAPEIDYNLRVIPSLAAVFGVPVGVSDHSADPELVPVLAAYLGAVAIEKHFCLSKKDNGLDDPIALEPHDFAGMVKAINKQSLGSERMIEFYKRERGENYIEKILGSGIKELAASERENYRLTNRSIHALRDIKAGEALKNSDYAVLRTEKNLRPGLDPYWEKSLLGRIAKRFIPAGEGIRFEDI